MKFNFIFLFFFTIICFGQKNLIKNGKSLDKIEIGYSTFSDVKEIYSSKIITDTLTYSCYYTDKCGTSGDRLNSLYLKKLGIVFQSDYDTGQKIKQIRLYEPFEGQIDENLKIKLGHTTVKDIYAIYPDLSVGSTTAKRYWIIENKKISFLITRLSTDKDYPIEHTEIENRLLKLIILYPDKTNEELYYGSSDNGRLPMFAPITETHRNYYGEKHKGGIYYINIGGESSYKKVKNGYWKEYYPNHILKEEGNYKKGKKVGIFKYYDENGKLIKSKKHHRFLFW